MAELSAVDVYRLMKIARGRHSHIVDEACFHGLIGVKFLRGNSPAVTAGRMTHDAKIAAAIDEGRCDAMSLECLHGFVDGIPFGDAAQVKSHAWTQELRAVAVKI